MLITEITLDPGKVIAGDPLRFRVGDPVIAGGFIIESIEYHPERRLYNKGNEIGFPCYAINFAGTTSRRLILEDKVGSIEVARETKETKPAKDDNIPGIV